jgi:flagellar protein FlaG
MDIKPTTSQAPAGPVPADRGVQNNITRTSAAPAASAAAPADTPQHAARVEQAVKTINASLHTQRQGVEFAIDSDSQRTVVKVVDQETQQVLRQMPTEEALDIAKAIDRMQGLLIKQEA